MDTGAEIFPKTVIPSRSCITTKYITKMSEGVVLKLNKFLQMSSDYILSIKFDNYRVRHQ